MRKYTKRLKRKYTKRKSSRNKYARRSSRKSKQYRIKKQGSYKKYRKRSQHGGLRNLPIETLRQIILETGKAPKNFRELSSDWYTAAKMSEREFKRRQEGVKKDKKIVFDKETLNRYESFGIPIADQKGIIKQIRETVNENENYFKPLSRRQFVNKLNVIEKQDQNAWSTIKSFIEEYNKIVNTFPVSHIRYIVNDAYTRFQKIISQLPVPHDFFITMSIDLMMNGINGFNPHYSATPYLISVKSLFQELEMHLSSIIEIYARKNQSLEHTGIHELLQDSQKWQNLPDINLIQSGVVLW